MTRLLTVVEQLSHGKIDRDEVPLKKLRSVLCQSIDSAVRMICVFNDSWRLSAFDHASLASEFLLLKRGKLIIKVRLTFIVIPERSLNFGYALSRLDEYGTSFIRQLDLVLSGLRLNTTLLLR